MDTAEYAALDRRHLWHPYTRHSDHAAGLPLITRAEGIHLFDATGRRYVDAISSWWSCALGHGHPRIVAAIRDQAAILQHSILGGLTHPPAIRLAAEVAHLMPSPDRHVHFASDGSCAVEAAVKIAVQYWANVGNPDRTRIVSLRDAYHGDTLATVSLGYLDHFHRPFRPLLHPAEQIPVPPYDGTEESCLAEAERLLGGHDTPPAALIVEPLCQCAAGMRIYPPAFLAALADLCRRHNVLLIADEIATGFCRTGRLFAFEHAGIDPDIVCIGKGLTGGALALSATVVKDAIFDTFGDGKEDHTFYHGHTFCGNPVAAAAALAALSAYRDSDLSAHAAAMESVSRDVLGSLAGRPGIRDLRILGMIAVVELEAGVTRDGLPAGRWIQRRMRDEGYLLRPLGNVVYLMLPLVASADDVRTAAETLRRAVEAAVS